MNILSLILYTCKLGTCHYQFKWSPWGWLCRPKHIRGEQHTAATNNLLYFVCYIVTHC